MDGNLFHTSFDQQIRRCAIEDEIHDIIKAYHDGPCGGHFVDIRIGHKVFQMRYFWSTRFRDEKKYFHGYDRY